MIRALVRGVFAALALAVFLVLVGFRIEALIALLLLAVAVMFIRSWYRNIPPLVVPAPHAAFPDPLREERGL